jgi:hypothetical protein
VKVTAPIQMPSDQFDAQDADLDAVFLPISSAKFDSVPRSA